MRDFAHAYSQPDTSQIGGVPEKPARQPRATKTPKRVRYTTKAAHTAPQKPSEAPSDTSKALTTGESKNSLPRVPLGLSLHVAATYEGRDLPEVVYY